MGRKRTNNYFDEFVENKILEYLDETSSVKRNLIYSKYIHKPLRIISEVYFSKISPTYLQLGSNSDRETLIQDCHSHLAVNVLPKFTKGKGKAYSYLSVAARNYFICGNTKAYRKYLKFNVTNIPEDLSTHYIDEYYDTKDQRDEFIEVFYSFISWCRKNIDTWKVIESRKTAIIETLDYMETFENPTRFPKDFHKEFHSKFSSDKDRFRFSRKFIWKQFVYYREMREMDILDPKPLKNLPLKKSLKKITQEQVDYIRKHHVHYSRSHGAREIAKKLKLNELVVRYVLEEDDFMST